MNNLSVPIIPFPHASFSSCSPHTLQAGGLAMKITNKHPSYENPQERAQRLADLKAICREKLKAQGKSAAKVG